MSRRQVDKDLRVLCAVAVFLFWVSSPGVLASYSTGPGMCSCKVKSTEKDKVVWPIRKMLT